VEKPRYSEVPEPMPEHKAVVKPGTERNPEVIIVGGGIAGLSAAIYLGRALREVLVIDAAESLALWEPEVQNYLGFPDGISGKDLLRRGREQAQRFGAQWACDEIEAVRREEQGFYLQGKEKEYSCRKLLLATGVYHLPPRIPEVDECVGKSMFFCKDCDGYRVQGKRVAIVGVNNTAVRYALGITTFTDKVCLLTNGETPHWDSQKRALLEQFNVPVFLEKIEHVRQSQGQIAALQLSNGECVHLDCLFTTRGDVYHNSLAQQLGARLDEDGQVIVDTDQRTNVPSLYAAGCVTTANCQMIIAAGDGATAAQAINSELFDECVKSGELLRERSRQVKNGATEPKITPAPQASKN
jgi:thioredoxin reductase (NADPH)